MICKKLFSVAVLMVGAVVVTACSHVPSLPASHPEALGEGRVACTECHEDQIKGILKPYASFSHTPVFVRNHRFYAGQDERLCASCHAASFCTDCHANEVEIKPAMKFGNRPDRELVHRGDFMTRHKIEGKMDPASCYRCHGRSNNELCVACHR